MRPSFPVRTNCGRGSAGGGPDRHLAFQNHCILKGHGVVESRSSIIRPDGTQPIRIADVRQVPLDRVPIHPDSASLVNRVMRLQSYTSRVDVTSFDSAI